MPPKDIEFKGDLWFIMYPKVTTVDYEDISTIQ
jgi:hypothetical protein